MKITNLSPSDNNERIEYESSFLFQKQIETTKRKKRLRVPGQIFNAKQEILSSLLQVFRPREQANKMFEEKKELVIAAIDTIYTSKWRESYLNQEILNPQQAHFTLPGKLARSSLKTQMSVRKIGRIREYSNNNWTTPIKRSASSTRVEDSGIGKVQFSDMQKMSRKINFDRQEKKFMTQQIESLRRRSGMLK